jgi:hypothetical protein
MSGSHHRKAGGQDGCLAMQNEGPVKRDDSLPRSYGSLSRKCKGQLIEDKGQHGRNGGHGRDDRSN